MRKYVLTLLVLVLLVSLVQLDLATSPTSAQQDWVINGTTVYVDDTHAYLSATPHTLTSSGWVEFELLSKHYEGNIDIVLGFVDEDNVKLKQPQIWRNNVAHNVSEWVEVQGAGNVTIGNITSYTPLEWDGIEPDIGNHNNTYLVELAISGNDTLIVAYNSYDQINSTTATFYYNYTGYQWEYYLEYYPDYKPLTAIDFTQEFYEYEGVDHWYYAGLGVPIQKNVLYKVRCWIDIPIVLGEFNSKYVWAVKPSGETVFEAKSNGHLYLLDPWLSGGWDQRVKFSVDAGDVDSDQTHFPILLEISASAGYNNDDISFVFDELQSDANRKKIAITKADGETQVYAEIEKWDDANEKAWVWVSKSDWTVDDTVDTEGYLYFDIDHADNTAYVGDTNDAVAENVWDSNFKFVSHMRDDPDTSHIRDSTTEDNDGTKKGAAEPAVTTSGKIDDAQHFDGLDDYITTPALTLDNFTIELWVNPDTLGVGRCLISNSVTNSPQMILRFRNGSVVNAYFQVSDDGGDAIAFEFTHGISTGNWAKIVVEISGTTGKVYVNNVEKGTDTDASFGLCTFPTVFYWGADSRLQAYLDGIEDECRISVVARGDAWRKASYESERDDLLDWGSEEFSAPTAATNTSTDIEDTTATLNGDVLSLNDTSINARGFVWDTTSRSEPDKDTAPHETPYANSWNETGSWSTGAFSHGVTGLTEATTYYFRAAARNNNNKWGWGDELTLLTKPAAPTNVAATDGVHTDKVVVTWTKSSGNVTGYKIYRDAGLIDTVGDVATYDDTGADASTITPGTSSATDGTSSLNVTLSVSGEIANNGTTHTYRVKAYNDSGDSDDSLTDTGYRGVGSLTYQWWRSSGDADSGYSSLAGATTDPYDDTTAPAPTIDGGNATASNGTSHTHVTLSCNEATSNGSGRYFLCELSATGAASQNSTSNRGYRGTTTLTYQWWRSWADVASNYSQIAGATTDPYNDAGGVVDPDGRYYLLTSNMTGATSQNSTADRGYIAAPAPPTVSSSNATGITETSAVFHGNVTSAGGVNVTTRGFEWGYFSGNYSFSWNETSADFGVGVFNHTISGLSECDEVFWRAFAVNSEGTGNSTELSFYTTCLLGPPTNFTITQTGASSANITWAIGLEALRTVIMGSEEGYPESPLDGYLVYNGTSTWVGVDGLSLSLETYSYRAWSWAGGNYSQDYAQASIGGKAMLAIFLGGLAMGLTALFFWKRNIVFAMGSSLGWLALGLILVLSPGTLGLPALSEAWVQILAYVFFIMAAGCLLWYISGIGKVRITRTDSETGKTWMELGKPPKEGKTPRSQQVKTSYKDRIKSVIRRRG